MCQIPNLLIFWSQLHYEPWERKHNWFHARKMTKVNCKSEQLGCLVFFSSCWYRWLKDSKVSLQTIWKLPLPVILNLPFILQVIKLGLCQPLRYIRRTLLHLNLFIYLMCFFYTQVCFSLLSFFNSNHLLKVCLLYPSPLL